MKKIFCILLAALLAFSVLSVPATAQDDAQATVSAAEAVRSDAGVNMNKGDSITVNYRDLTDRSNVAIPKGGHLEWFWVCYDGRAEFSLSADKKNCTVHATRGGAFALGCDVVDANGNKVSYDALLFLVSTPLITFLNIVTLTMYTRIAIAFWTMIGRLTLATVYDIT